MIFKISLQVKFYNLQKALKFATVIMLEVGVGIGNLP